MGHVIDIATGRMRHTSTVAKGDLARQVNQLVERLKTLTTQNVALAELLTTIAVEPSALTQVDGVVTLDAAAMRRVPRGTSLHLEPQGNLIVLKATPPDVPPDDDIPPAV